MPAFNQVLLKNNLWEFQGIKKLFFNAGFKDFWYINKINSDLIKRIKLV